MPRLLILPEQYFLNIRKQMKCDFVGWQLCIADTETKTTTWGEIGESAQWKEGTFSATLRWAVEHYPETGWHKAPSTAMQIPLLDHCGVSHDDGGCHFDPGMTTSTKFILHPPGTMEKSEDAASWEDLKRMAT